MPISGYFFDAVESGGVYDRVYSAAEFSKYLDKLVGNGVFRYPSSQLQVRAGSGMQVIVAAGQGWIDGHKLINSADFAITIATADPLLKRLDRVVFYCDYNNREMGIAVKKGTAAANPTAPALIRNASRYEMSLAIVTVNKTVTSISNANITDTRADSSVCGWVVGLVEQVDTSTLFQQWNTAYADYYASTKQQLDDFMETLTQELRVNTFVKHFQKNVNIVDSSDRDITLNMTGYTYESTDFIMVYVNGFLGVEGVDYDINASGSSAVIELSMPGPFEDATASVIVLKSVIGIENM